MLRKLGKLLVVGAAVMLLAGFFSVATVAKERPVQEVPCMRVSDGESYYKVLDQLRKAGMSEYEALNALRACSNSETVREIENPYATMPTPVGSTIQDEQDVQDLLNELNEKYGDLQ